MSGLVVTQPSPLLAAADENARVIRFVEEGVELTEISPAEAGDPAAADKKSDWIAVQLPSGEKGFLRGETIKSPEASPQAIDQDMFFTQLRFESAAPLGRTDHHYLFALTVAESGVNILLPSPGSDAVGPFKYSSNRWAELVADYGSAPLAADATAALAITTAHRSDLAKRMEMAAREAHGDADKIQQLLGRTAQYNELYTMHVLGLKGGNAVLALSADHPEISFEEALRQGGLSTDELGKLVQANPELVKGSIAQVLDAAATMLSPGFDKAAELALRLDPPEMQAAAAPSLATSTPSRDARGISDYKDVARQVLTFFTVTTQGRWSPPQAIGIIANIYSESKFNPKIPGDGGAAYGLCQWHSDRQQNFTRQFRKSIKNSTFEDQLQFVDFELHNSEKGGGDRLRHETTPEGAAKVISLFYERPAGKETEAEARSRIATAFAQLLA